MRQTGTSKDMASSLARIPIAGFLAWLVPGLGHFFLGLPTRGIIFLVTITVTFWSGVAIGGVCSTVDPHERTLWFFAQLGTAGNTMAAYGLNRRAVARQAAAGENIFVRYWASSEVGVHYTGVAGLLNLLVIFDAIARADGSLSRRKEPRTSGAVP